MKTLSSSISFWSKTKSTFWCSLGIVWSLRWTQFHITFLTMLYVLIFFKLFSFIYSGFYLITIDCLFYISSKDSVSDDYSYKFLSGGLFWVPNKKSSMFYFTAKSSFIYKLNSKALISLRCSFSTKSVTNLRNFSNSFWLIVWWDNLCFL